MIACYYCETPQHRMDPINETIVCVDIDENPVFT